MKSLVRTFRFDDLEYFRFSLYYFGRNMQTVYVFRAGEVLIDTAQEKSRSCVLAALGNRPCSTILITHFHEDHTGNAEVLQRRWNAEVFAHPLAAGKLKEGVTVSPLGRLLTGRIPRLRDVRPLSDGQRIERGGFTFETLYTPGHTEDHLAFYEPDRGWLFPGDLYVADRIKYFETNESLADQIRSLRRMVALEFDALFCSHNPKVKGGKARLERKLELFEELYGTVAELHGQGMPAESIFRQLHRKENWFYRIVTAGHFSAVNLVHSAIRDASDPDRRL